MVSSTTTVNIEVWQGRNFDYLKNKYREKSGKSEYQIRISNSLPLFMELLVWIKMLVTFSPIIMLKLNNIKQVN